MNPPEATIVVPALNEAHFLPGLLASLEPLRADPRIEVLVADAGSRDDTPATAARHGCRVVSSPVRIGPGRARNMGAAASHGRVLAFLDADVVVMPGWIDSFRRFIDAGAAVRDTLTGDQYHVSREPGWIERVWFQPIRTRVKSYINGGNIVLLRATFDAIGGFDERLETGEDVEFSQRAAARGVRVVRDEAFAVHHEGFPKTVRRFVLREAWHGKGDFLGLATILRSRIALATLAFAGAHLAALLALLLGRPLAAMALMGGAAALCVLLYCQQMGRVRFGAGTLGGCAVAWLYFVGRSIAAWRALRERVQGPTEK